ncbi:CAAX prenyl protease-related protein [Chitinivorax sp. PXF-14]|uniref:CAAX prenyl protease-related protein n=1 Tax=Chitinivorax sp. PXF-14 TaxID=3230488 RepID=UPI0034672E11
MNKSQGALIFGYPRTTVARILPMALYFVFLAASPWLSKALALDAWASNWLYGAKVATVVAALLYFVRDYGELRAWRLPAATWLLSLATGLVVFGLWIVLVDGWMVMGEMPGYRPLAADGSLDWAQVAVRWFGAALVVPVMEELFWRSFLLRWLSSPAFLQVDPRRGDARAFWITAVLFGVEHQQWLAGIVAGVAYNWLYRRTGSLWAPIVAHAVTNGVLGWWVVSQGAWQFW